MASAAELIRIARESWDPHAHGVDRAPGGTRIGGRFVSLHGVIDALTGSGHHDAARHLRANPPSARPLGRTSTRWTPSEREVRGHARLSAEHGQLSDRIRRLDEDLAAPQFEGGRMSDPQNRRQARMTRDELARQRDALTPRVETGNRHRQQYPDVYGGEPAAASLPADTPVRPAAAVLSDDPAVAAARARIAEIENRKDATGTPIQRPGYTMDLGSLTSDEQMQLYLDRQLVAGADAPTTAKKAAPSSKRTPATPRSKPAAAKVAAALTTAELDEMTSDEVATAFAQGRVSARVAARRIREDAQSVADHPAIYGSAALRGIFRRPDPTSPEWRAATERARVRSAELRAVADDIEATTTKTRIQPSAVLDRREAVGVTGEPTEEDARAALARLSGAQLRQAFKETNTEYMLSGRASLRKLGDKRGKAFGTTATDEELRDDLVSEMLGQSRRTRGNAGDSQVYAQLLDVALGVNPPATKAAPSVPAKRTAAAKVAKAKASVDHVSIAEQVKAAGSEDDVRRLLQGQTLTVADLKTIAGHVGGPATAAKGNKQQIIDRIAAGSGGLKGRPMSVFAGEWNLAAAGMPTEQATQAHVSPEEAARRAAIVAAPRAVVPTAQSRGDYGMGVFSTDPEIRRSAEQALAAAGAASEPAHRAAVYGQPVKRTAAQKVARAKTGKRPAAEVAAAINAAGSIDEAQSHLDGLTVSDLKQVAAELKIPLRGGDKAAIRHDIAFGVVGFKAIFSSDRADYAQSGHGSIFADPNLPQTPGASRPKADGGQGSPSADLTGANGLSDDPAVREVQVENRIREAYQGLARRERSYVALTDLRERAGVEPAEFDATLRRLATEGGHVVALAHKDGRKSAAEESASLRHAGLDMHMVAFADASPRPLPDKAPAKRAPRKAPTKAAPSVPAKATKRTAAAKVAKATAAGWSPSKMTTVGADPSDVAEQIAQAADANAAADRMAGMTVADLRKVARELSVQLPKPPEGRWTPDALRQYILDTHMRDRFRWSIR